MFLLAHRRIIRKERRGKALYKQKRPQSRTIAKVHEAYLEDVIWPHDVVGQKEVRPPFLCGMKNAGGMLECVWQQSRAASMITV